MKPTAPTPTASTRRRVTLAASLLLCVLTACPLAGCRSAQGPYSDQSEAARSPAQAERLTLEAADRIAAGSDKDLDRAEALLREALAADLFHGPAHNNLGVVHLKRGRLYEAASEFEWARKLMPGHPDPRVNLALTLERAGRVDDAAEAYGAALEVHPGHMPATQGLARLEARHGREGAGSAARLRTIALEGTSAAWRDWARGRMAQFDDASGGGSAAR